MDMMFALMRKKLGMTKGDFIDYYETNHVPLVMSIIGDYIHAYERNYLDYTHHYTRMPAGEEKDVGQPLDVVTRVVWKDLEGARRVMTDPRNVAAIARDEENFLDRASMQVIIVPEGHSRLTQPQATSC